MERKRNEKLLAIEIIFRDICSDWRKDHKLLERLEIAEKLVQDIINDSCISGGEKNRIILARSLIHSKNILIFLNFHLAE